MHCKDMTQWWNKTLIWSSYVYMPLLLFCVNICIWSLELFAFMVIQKAFLAFLLHFDYIIY